MVRTYPHYNPFSVRNPEPLNWDEVFSDNQNETFNLKKPLYLEIGCSNGRWLFDYARKYPEKNIIGVETRGKYVQLVEERIKKYEFDNVYVLRANINTALETLFETESINDVFILFPDPWYKEKHLKRRVIKPDFLDALSQKMLPDGILHVATDKESFAYELLEVLEASSFVNCNEQFADSTVMDIVTEIEEYNLNLGKTIYRLNFQKK